VRRAVVVVLGHVEPDRHERRVDVDNTATDNSTAGGATGSFSADDTDGDGVEDDIDADPFDAGVQ
jgi:hypothetical protein